MASGPGVLRFPIAVRDGLTAGDSFVPHHYCLADGRRKYPRGSMRYSRTIDCRSVCKLDGVASRNALYSHEILMNLDIQVDVLSRLRVKVSLAIEYSICQLLCRNYRSNYVGGAPITK